MAIKDESDLLEDIIRLFEKTLEEKGYKTYSNPAEANDDKLLLKNVTSQQFFFGGSTETLHDESFFKNLAEENPWLFSGSIAPIYDLIEDKRRQEAMKKATEIYLNGSFSVEQESFLEAGIAYFEDGNVTNLEDLRKSIKSGLTVANDTYRLLSEQLLAPSWWRHTSLCFYTFPEKQGKEKVCENLKDGPGCAPVGQLTARHLDATYHGAACFMTWTLSNHHKVDGWFKNIQFCMRYSATGDKGQCGGVGLENGEFCAPLNENTTSYRDQTDQRPGGCLLAWKLKLETDDPVPTWFQNVRLCYQPSVHPKAGFASKWWYDFPGRCAYVNQWTEDYLDDNNHIGPDWPGNAYKFSIEN